MNLIRREKPDWLKKKEELFEKAMEFSRSLPEGFQVGKIIRKQVADGYAFYEITKVNKKTVKLVWREDLTLDDYQDSFLLDGGTFDKTRIQHFVDYEDALNRIFKERK